MTVARRRRKAGSRTRRGFAANTPAAKQTYAIPPGSAVGGKGRAKYPINTAGRARNAIQRVTQFGSAAEKRMVYAAVRKRYPGIAKRSTVVPTASGSGRRYGERKGTRHRR